MFTQFVKGYGIIHASGPVKDKEPEEVDIPTGAIERFAKSGWIEVPNSYKKDMEKGSSKKEDAKSATKADKAP